MNDDAEDVQRDDELSATSQDAAGAAAREIQKDIHTQLPGQIVSYNAATQTAVVKPMIQRIMIDGSAVDIPSCMDVPVHCPRGGGFVLTFPVAAGDECLLCFSERAIDFWYDNGGAQLPSEYRMHDFSDAFAFVGFSSKPNALTNVATDAAELRTLDGTTMFRLEAGAAIAGTKVGAQLAIMGQAFRQAQALMHAGPAGLAATFTAMAGACTGPLAALEAGFTALAAAVAKFETGAAGYLATKAKVG